jgi:hypothetical protein
MGFVKPVFLIVFTALLVLLALSMKRHHYMDGLRYHHQRYGSPNSGSRP